MRLPFAVIGEHYRLEAPIGEGGFGAVYRAVDMRIDRPVAVKLLHRELMGTGDVEARFLREAELAKRLQHPNTVRLIDFGRAEDGTPFLVFELLTGESLDELLAREGGLAPERVTRIGMQVLKSLLEAHTLGIVHRDIKPQNLFLSRHAGEPDFVKVLDFGVAKAPQAETTKLTQTGLTIGTPNYMAPEQLRAEPVAAASDLYAVGLVLAEALCGRTIILGATPALTIVEQLADRPVPLPPEVIHSPLGAVIQRATQKAIERRYSSADQMLADIQRPQPSHATIEQTPFAHVATAPAPFAAPPTQPAWPVQPVAMVPVATGSSKSGVWVGLVVGALALVAVVGGVAAWTLRRQAEAAPEETEEVPSTPEKSARVEPSAAPPAVTGVPITAELHDELHQRSEKIGFKIVTHDLQRRGALVSTDTAQRGTATAVITISDFGTEQAAQNVMQETTGAVVLEGPRLLVVLVTDGGRTDFEETQELARAIAGRQPDRVSEQPAAIAPIQTAVPTSSPFDPLQSAPTASATARPRVVIPNPSAAPGF